ncbi:MAG: hypothetical protein GTO41_00795 [Burkholderiales bacterium]|nr:hypothetical protein [Burkholderiales bacterium]
MLVYVRPHCLQLPGKLLRIDIAIGIQYLGTSRYLEVKRVEFYLRDNLTAVNRQTCARQFGLMCEGMRRS